MNPSFSISDYVSTDFLHLGPQGVYKRAVSLAICAVETMGNFEALAANFALVGKSFWTNGVETQESLSSIRLSFKELAGRTNISILRALHAAIYDPRVLPDPVLLRAVWQFLDDILAVHAAFGTIAPAEKIAHLRGVVLPRLRHKDTVRILGRFDNPSGDFGEDDGKQLDFTKFHIFVAEIEAQLSVWGSASNGSMSVFENANKHMALIAQHCLSAGGKFLIRMARLAEQRYFFRFSADQFLNSDGVVTPFPASLVPASLSVTFPPRASLSTLAPADPFFPLFLSALAARGLDGPSIVRTACACLTVGFTRSNSGVCVSDAPLRSGDFTIAAFPDGQLSLLKISGFAVADLGHPEDDFFFASVYQPTDPLQRQWKWDGSSRLVGRVADLRGRTLTFCDPRDRSAVLFSPVTSRLVYF